jgi:phosphoribosylanthranilate isomerase
MTIRPPFQIKICGITRPNDAVAAALAGADAIGLNFFQGSPRFVSSVDARKIVGALEIAGQRGEIRRPLIVGVFVNSSPAKIAETVSHCFLDAIQFHGQESTEILHQLAESLIGKATHRSPKGLLTIRVLRLSTSSTLEEYQSPTPGENQEFAQILTEAVAWKKAGVDAILLDSAAPGTFGGSGKKIDWSLVRQFDLGLPLILAGGLNPGNIAEAMAETGVLGVDVASGVESAPGIKDELLMRQFVHRSGLVD